MSEQRMNVHNHIQSPSLDSLLKGATLIKENSYSRIFKQGDLYFRLTPSDGLCEVYKSGSRYTFLRRLLSPDECTRVLDKPFIEQCLESVPALAGGKCIQMFAGLGGIVYANDAYYRVSITRGVQKVRKGLERWRTLEYVCSGMELKQLLAQSAKKGN